VTKSIDMESLLSMMSNMETVEVSRKETGETTRRGEAKIVETKAKATKAAGKKTGTAKTSSKKKATAKSSSTSKATAKKVSATKGSKKDDLTKIEGIGPKIAGLLNKAGVYTWAELSKTKVSFIQDVLTKAGPRYKMHSPKTWPQQSKLAAKGKWDELKKLQDELDGGR